MMDSRGPTTSQRPSPLGFTSVEMLTVIVLVGVVAAIAFNRVDLNRLHVNTATQAITTTMVTAQREAITKQHDVIVTFDAGRRSLRMIWDLNNDGDPDPGEHVRPVPLGDRVTFGLGGAPPRGFGSNPINFNHVVGGLPALIFHRNGSASGVGGFYLTTDRAVTAAGGGSTAHAIDTRAVEIVRATGRTEWYRYDGAGWSRGF
jgi:hypothetical protein